jgi:two-component system NarL family sensor kinase
MAPRFPLIARDRSNDSDGVTRAVATFILSGLAAMIVLGLVGAWVLRGIGTREAIRDARELTRITGVGIVEPALEHGVLTGDQAAIDRLDAIVENRVVHSNNRIVRVKLWTPDGRIVYSDEEWLIGQKFPPRTAELAEAREKGVVAEVSELTEPENRYDRGHGKLLEVYLPLTAPDGSPLLFETYRRYDVITGRGESVWRSFAPAFIAALILLELVQVPLALSMARRIRASRREREGLLRRAVEASEDERRRIASDLHDGVVQDLAGLSYHLDAAAGRSDDESAGQLRDGASEARRAMRQLRSLLVEIYPPSLHKAGLEAALADLVARLPARGVQPTLEVGTRDLPRDVQEVVYRAAQEAIRNVVAHAGATEVLVRVDRQNGDVQLAVTDNGRGFTEADLERRQAEGHFGLSLLEELAMRTGGRLALESAPGSGTSVKLSVPTP